MRADVVIVGAGTAGAATALQCARRGLRVVVLERRRLAEAGAKWHNGVPGWAFDEAGIDRPVAPELAGEGQAFHMVAGWGPERLRVTDHDVLEVDMGALVARLQRDARAAGAVFVDEARVLRCEGGHLETSVGPFEARWFVDASGFGGAGLMATERVAPEDVCAASQESFAIADVPAAEAWFRERGVTPGETLCYTGVAGGFSTVNARMHGDTLGVLTGSIPAHGHPAGRALVAAFVRELPWVGPRRSGGASPIPLRRPHAVLATERVALIGDAACQVFAAHGSGISAQLVASRLLAEALADGAGPLGYQWRWQRQWGGLFAAYDLFRRYTETLTPADVARLMRSGILHADMLRDGMQQRWPRVDLRRVLAMARSGARDPAALSRLLPVVARMGVARALYAAYPRRVGHIPLWARRVERALGR